MHQRRTVAATVTAILAATLSFAGQASANTESHCVLDVVDELQDGVLITGQTRCYATFAEAMLDASNGALTLPTDVGGSVVFTDESVALAVSSFTLGIHYDGTSGTGSSISVVGSSCSGGHWNTGATWANRISSSWNGCGHLRHWDGPSKTGSYQTTSGVGTTDNLTTLNNKAESVSYHP